MQFQGFGFSPCRRRHRLRRRPLLCCEIDRLLNLSQMSLVIRENERTRGRRESYRARAAWNNIDTASSSYPFPPPSTLLAHSFSLLRIVQCLMCASTKRRRRRQIQQQLMEKRKTSNSLIESAVRCGCCRCNERNSYWNLFKLHQVDVLINKKRRT